MMKTFSLIIMLYSFPFIAFSSEKASDNKPVINGDVVVSFDNLDVSTIVNPILHELSESHKSVRETLDEAKTLLINLQETSKLNDQQKEEILSTIKSLASAASSIKRLIDNPKPLLDDFQYRFTEVVNKVSVAGLWSDFKTTVYYFQILFYFYLLVVLIAVGFIIYILFSYFNKFNSIVLEMQRELKIASESFVTGTGNLKTIAKILINENTVKKF